MDKGTYRLSIGELDGDVSYGLRIEYNGNVYISEPARPLHTPDIKELSWEQPEPYGDVYFRVSTGEARLTNRSILYGRTGRIGSFLPTNIPNCIMITI